MKNSIGDRVGAIMGSDGKTVKLFGFGVYAGNFVPPKNSGGLGDLLHDANVENPRIDLDNGKSVYGCECWWGAEDEVKKRIDGLVIITVDIDEARKANE